MEEEYLKELDTIIKLSLFQARAFSKSSIPNVDNRSMLAHNFKINLEGYSADISKILYEIDLAQNGFTKDSIQSYIDKISRPKPLFEPNIEDYVKENSKGYLINDGNNLWIPFSKQSKVEVKIEPDSYEQNNYKIIINAYDPVNDNRINRELKGPLEQYMTYVEDYGLPPSNDMYYEDPLYQSAKFGNSIAGSVAGYLEVQKIGQHYRNWKQPLSGHNFEKALGRWKSADGVVHSFKEFEGLNGFQKGSKKASAYWARQRGLKAAKGFRVAGKVFFGISVGFSLNDSWEAVKYQDSNWSGVVGKSALDVTMSVVAFIPVYGWAISGTYFIFDWYASDKDYWQWGQPTGNSHGMPYGINPFEPSFSPGMPPPFYGIDSPYETEFKMEYIPPLEQIRLQEALENRVRIDNTYVAPKILFKR